MTPRALPKWILGALLVGAIAEHASLASACSLPLCSSPVRMPPSPWLPANMVYFKVLQDEPGTLSLRTAEGQPIAASIRTIGSDRVFAPDEPVASSTSLVLEYTMSCYGEEAPPQAYEFMADLPGAIELIPAQLVVEERGTRLDASGRVRESFARVRHHSGDNNGFASPLMTHTYTLDGAVLWGADGMVEVDVSCAPELTTPISTTCGNVSSVPPGVHTIEARTTIVGAAEQPAPVRLDVEVRCPEPEVSQETPEDAVGDRVDDRTGDGPGEGREVELQGEPVQDAVGAVDQQTPIAAAGPSSSSDGGCALARSAPGSAAGAFWALAGVLLVCSRRLRRR